MKDRSGLQYLEQYPAMRLRIDPVSRIERVVSIAVATVATVAGALLVLSAPASPSVPALVRDGGQVSEHLAFLIAPLPSTVAPARSVVQRSSTDESRGGASPQRLKETSLRNGDTVESATTEAMSRSNIRVEMALPDTGSRWRSPAVSPLLSPNPMTNEKSERTAGSSGVGPNGRFWATASAFVRRHPPMSFDSALRVVRGDLAASIAEGQLKRTPSTQADRDMQSRSDALADVAASSAGRPMTHTMSGGGRIDAPLPFGGPSRKHRERDSTINAQTMEMLSRLRRRADSAEVTQQRRHADSLARIEHSPQHIEDSLRGSQP